MLGRSGGGDDNRQVLCNRRGCRHIGPSTQVAFDANNLTALGATVDGGDYFGIYDSDTSTTKKVLHSNLGFGASNGAILSNGSNNRIVTTGAININGEANLTFDGSQVYVNGKIGIGDTSPSAMLTINHDGDIRSVGDPAGVSLRLGAGDNAAGNNKSSRIEMVEDCNASEQLLYGFFIDYDGDADSGFGNGQLNMGMRNNSTTDTNVFRIDRNATADSLCISEDGVGVGTDSPASKLDVRQSGVASGFAAEFHHDGGNSTNYGIKIQCGEDGDTSGVDSYFVMMYDGDGDFAGSITRNGEQ